MNTCLAQNYNFQDYCQYHDDNDGRYELVEGELIPITPPSFLHLLIGDRLSERFKARIKQRQLPLLCLKEAGIRTGYQKSRIADLIVVEKDLILPAVNRVAICESPPALVVEIVSPESRQRDYRYKRSEYAANGIPEYWIVDPEQEQVWILVFNEGLYDKNLFTGNDLIISPLFSDLDLTVSQLFDYGN